MQAWLAVVFKCLAKHFQKDPQGYFQLATYRCTIRLWCGFKLQCIVMPKSPIPIGIKIPNIDSNSIPIQYQFNTNTTTDGALNKSI